MDPSLRQIASLDPLAQQYAVAVTDELRAAGYPAVVVEGFRSARRQAQLYAQGRTITGRRVTNVRISTHQKRRAWDTAFLVDGRITWDVPDDWWEALGDVGEAYGLRWGGRFAGLRDQPHLEMP